MTINDWALIWKHDNSTTTSLKYKNCLKFEAKQKDVCIQGQTLEGLITARPTNISKWKWVFIIIFSKNFKSKLIFFFNFFLGDISQLVKLVNDLTLYSTSSKLNNIQCQTFCGKTKIGFPILYAILRLNKS